MFNLYRSGMRWLCLTVSFPVGVGSGLLPRPLEVKAPVEAEQREWRELKSGYQEQQIDIFSAFSLFRQQRM